MSLKYGSSKSIYCYSDTDILINNLDIKDEDLLEEAEGLYSAQRLLELEASPIKGAFDFDHIKRIHHYIFQDIFPFAGEVREENISKGNTRFASVQFIEPCANDLFHKLKSENHLLGLSKKEFSGRAAFYMAELNMLHPFREGNGRTIREFLRNLALNCGFNLNWDAVDKEELLVASIESTVNVTHLEECIYRTIEAND
jgi:cell filamentation protein